MNAGRLSWMWIALWCVAGIGAVHAGEALPAEPCFEDWTQKVGLDKVNPALGGTFVDINEDGYPDIVFGGWEFYLNDKGKKLVRLEPQPEMVSADKNVRPHGVCFGQIANSGHLDMVMAFMNNSKSKDWKDSGRRNEVWLGDGKGHFTLKKDTGLSTAPQPTATPCLFDFDGDGKLDLFVGNWIEGDGATDSYLYKGHGDGTFEDVTEKAGLKLDATMGTRKSRRPIFSVTHTDYNNSGLQSLAIGTYAGYWNLLFKNNGDGTFTDVGRETGYDCDVQGRIFAYGSPDFLGSANTGPAGVNVCLFSCPFADYNCSGYMSCFQSTVRHWDIRDMDPSMLLTNMGAKNGFKFQRDLTAIPLPTPTLNYRGAPSSWGDLHATWIDVDNDGWEDLIVASSDYPDEQILKLYHQIPGTGRFEDWTPRLGFRWVQADGISLGDFTRDGTTDILVARSNHMRLTEEQQKKYPLANGLFKNTIAKALGNGFFNLRLKGQNIGARVTIRTGDHQQIREVYSCIGIGAQRNDDDCRFGVGKAKIVDEVTVRWPDRPNTVQTFKNVAPNKFYTLKKGGKLEVVP